jgi:hypothetical protein
LPQFLQRRSQRDTTWPARRSALTNSSTLCEVFLFVFFQDDKHKYKHWFFSSPSALIFTYWVDQPPLRLFLFSSRLTSYHLSMWHHSVYFSPVLILCFVFPRPSRSSHIHCSISQKFVGTALFLVPSTPLFPSLLAAVPVCILCVVVFLPPCLLAMISIPPRSHGFPL